MLHNETAITVDNIEYELIENERDAWDEDTFLSRHSDILNKYDYIVGDWAHEQLRLKGFYNDANKKAAFDNKISTLNDYILEFCNFGCAYFVLKRLN
ncbi:YutD family protein [Tuberibacillus sp. Marseille-P3662]|uniref:YutD family protein n=1 Tax=Tuberibacillus sp. Marseille-P3662 TaxID=1965358 RepID=UPI000A1CC7AB|nr:YutD-like domain-containing protein [Tuberibacillus sp. Marseille-P3662]